MLHHLFLVLMYICYLTQILTQKGIVADKFTVPLTIHTLSLSLSLSVSLSISLCISLSLSLSLSLYLGLSQVSIPCDLGGTKKKPKLCHHWYLVVVVVVVVLMPCAGAASR